jgi:rhamnogalacturonyl hydrolase YesR
MQKAKLTSSANHKTLKGYLTKLAAGIAAKQDAKSGCWYQLINHDGSFSASNYDSSYRYTSGPVNNYLESSCTAIFTAAYLKGVRLGLLNKFYRAIAKKAYKGFIEQFMVADGKGGVHLIRCCKSAGLGGGSYRDGSAAYYLMGKDTEPTSTNGDDFYTEGKVLGGFIMAATEYERMKDR